MKICCGRATRVLTNQDVRGSMSRLSPSGLAYFAKPFGLASLRAARSMRSQLKGR